jgi:hypothetical protein
MATKNCECRVAFASVLLLSLGQLLQAQVACVPLAFGVPALSGPPIWWDADGNNTIPEIVHPAGCVGGACLPAEIVSLADPRWARAVSNSGFDPSAAPQYAEFRAVFQGTDLYLSWQALLDPALNLPTSTREDALWFGIKQTAGKPAVIVKLTLNTNMTSLQESFPRPGDPSVYYKIDMLTNTGTSAATSNWTASPLATSNWIKAKSRVWTKWPGGTGNKASWAFQTVVPKNALGLASGLDFGNPFEMWYALVVDGGSAGVAQYQLPDRGVVISPAGANLPNPWVTTDWHPFSLGVAPAGMTCEGQVSLSSDQIGTTNPIVSKISFTPPGSDPNARTPNTTTNTFFVRPKNEQSAAAISQGTLHARFYLANWGTQPNWNDVPPGNTIGSLWRDITPTPTHSNAAQIPASSVATLAQGIQFQWPAIPDCERYDYLADPYPGDCPTGTKRLPHQCLLVELFSPATSLTFINKSVYRNMDIVPGSKFERTASVSVERLTPISDGRPDRDVYLFVETINMPAVIRGRTGGNLSPQDTSAARRRDHPAQPDSGEIVAVDSLSSAQRDSLMPTYRIYAWHATGDSITMGGETRPIVRAQTAFGYWIDHKGELQGWRHQLKGAHLTQLGPNLYKISVPNNGFTTVTTTIEALEPRPLALSLHAGVSIPNGNFNTGYDAGFGITADAEYWFRPTFAIAALAGYHRFNGALANPDLDLFHLSGALEARIPSGSTAVLIDAGGGIYNFSPGSTDPGVHAGAGVEFEVTPVVALGVTGRVHTVFTSGSNTTFSSIQAGGRIRF